MWMGILKPGIHIIKKRGRLSGTEICFFFLCMHVLLICRFDMYGKFS